MDQHSLWTLLMNSLLSLVIQSKQNLGLDHISYPQRNNAEWSQHQSNTRFSAQPSCCLTWRIIPLQFAFTSHSSTKQNPCPSLYRPDPPLELPINQKHMSTVFPRSLLFHPTRQLLSVNLPSIPILLVPVQIPNCWKPFSRFKKRALPRGFDRSDSGRP